MNDFVVIAVQYFQPKFVGKPELAAWRTGTGILHRPLLMEGRSIFMSNILLRASLLYSAAV